MNKTKLFLLIKILICIISAICLMSIYVIMVKYSNVIQDEFINSWANIYPLNVLIKGLVSLLILLFSLKHKAYIFELLNVSKTIKIALFLSLPFVIFATLTWFYANGDFDAIELGDSIWKLGHPLTFLIIDIPIYLKGKFGLSDFLNYSWMYPFTIVLFVLQFSIFTHGARILLNFRKVKKRINRR